MNFHYIHQDKLILHAILAFVSTTITPILASCKTSNTACTILTGLYVEKSQTHAMQLKEALTLNTNSSCSVIDFLQAVKILVDELAIINHSTLDDDLTLYILNGLGLE